MRRDGTAPRPKVSRIGALLLPLLYTLGCGILDEGDPENARVVMEGAQGISVQLVTTNDFVVYLDEQEGSRSVDVLSADTAMVSLPFRKTYSLGQERRFFMRVLSEDPLPEPMTVKVFIDEDLRFNRTSLLGDDRVEFTYTLR